MAGTITLVKTLKLLLVKFGKFSVSKCCDTRILGCHYILGAVYGKSKDQAYKQIKQSKPYDLVL